VRNRFLSVDPYMHGRMRDTASYTPSFALGAVMSGIAVGEVVASRSADLAAGDIVLHDLGWREYALGPVNPAHTAARPPAYPPPRPERVAGWSGLGGGARSVRRRGLIVGLLASCSMLLAASVF